jgi:hypothetical protein
MLLQTNSYIVPKDKRSEHARLVRRFRQTLLRLGCDHFEVYEQVGSNWSSSEASGRYVQLMRFVDRKHQLAVQAAERSDPTAQAVIQEFCDLINFPYQQQQGLFAVGFYTSVLPSAPRREDGGEMEQTLEQEPGTEAADAGEVITEAGSEPVEIPADSAPPTDAIDAEETAPVEEESPGAEPVTEAGEEPANR